MEDINLSEIGMYEAVEPLREVPEGVLYRAIEKNSGAPVLVKIYYPSLAWSEEILNEFFNLLSYLRFIEHDNLLPILDMGKHNGKPYIVFPGETAALLHDRPAASASRTELLGFYYKIASALDFLHKQEILHGSLNTQNILISGSGDPKLFDYGLSGVFKKLLLENLEEGFENLAVSNLHCTAPEQIMGRSPSRASDIYACGMVLYYYTFGGFPVDGKTTPAVALSLLDQQKFEIGKIPSHIPAGALSLLQKCLQPAPEDRFASFAQILNALERLQAGKGIRLRYKKRFDTPSKIPRRTLWYALGILTLAALFAAYQFYPRQTDTPHPAPPTPAPTTQAFPSPKPPPATTPTSVLPPASPPATSETLPPSTAPAPAVLKPAVEGEQPGVPVQALSPVNIAQLTELARLGYGKPEDADASANNQYFAVATSAGVFLFKENTFFSWIDPQGWATSVQFSTDGNTLAIGLDSGEIQLWDWKNETRKAVLNGHTARVSKIIFSSNDRLLYSASHDQNVIVWDLNQNRIVRKIPAHALPINDIAISSDGRTLITCADDQLIRIWDVQVGSKIYEFNFNGKAQALAISSDNAYFAAGGDSGFIYQWNLINSRSSANNALQLRTDPIPAKARVWSLAYINNDTGLLAGLDDGNYTLFNPARKSYTSGLNFVIQPPIKNLLDVFGPKFKFESRAFQYGEKIISINWDGKVTVQQLEVLAPAYDILDRLDFSPDGSVLASGGRRGTVNAWNLDTNQVLYRSAVPIPFGDSLAPDGSSLVVLDKKTVRITQSGEHIVEESYRQVSLNGRAVVGGLSESVRGGWVSFARSGTVLIAANLNQSKTWDYSNGFETYSAWRKDNGCLITASQNDGEILQILSPAGLLPQWNDFAKRICAKSAGANLPAFSHNLTFMAYVNSNGLIEGFDVESGQSRWRFKPPSRITALAVSPAGDLVAAGTEKGELIFLDAKSGSLLAAITGNFKAVRAIRFSDDSVKLATAGDDGVTRLFGIPPSR